MNTRSKPTITGAFQAGMLYAVNNHNKLLVGIFSDFDVIKSEITTMVESKPVGLSVLINPEFEILPEDTKTWSIKNEKIYERVFTRFFRQFKTPSAVRNKPNIEKLVLIPFAMDHPFVPNDFLDCENG